MIKVGITGIDGLIGWHLRSFLHGQKDIELRGADKREFADKALLHKFVTGCDVIVHLAGLNRGDEAEVARANVEITQTLLGACRAAGAKPHIIFSSSTHIYRDTAYGKSKRGCTELIRAWAADNKAVFTNLILPNVFGEGGQPFYNSAVSTFCHQLAKGQEPEIIKDIEVELLHAQRVARAVLALINNPVDGDVTPGGQKLLVSRLLAKLKEIAELYNRQIIPDIRTPQDLDLFNTYRSYLYPQAYPVGIAVRKDARGELFEAVKGLNGGQTFISTTEPGVTRGNHYHTLKVERFLVIKGQAVIRIRKLFSNEIKEFVVYGTTPGYIDIPALHTHNITNTGAGELLTLFWANEMLDPQNPDTYQETV